MNVADELQKLQQLHQSGAISDEEFAQAKSNLLNPPPGGLEAMFGSAGAGVTEQQARIWAVCLHLSQLAGYIIVPVAGLIAPILIWQFKKDDIPSLDAHGKIVTNWLISLLMYIIVSFGLAFVLIGFPMLMALGILAIVFPIIGGIKANNGEAWRYPLSIPFFK